MATESEEPVDGEGDVDVEWEKTKSWELGKIVQLENTADDLRERAGDLWAHAGNHTDHAKAKQLKELAAEFEEEAEERREKRKEKYDD